MTDAERRALRQRVELWSQPCANPDEEMRVIVDWLNEGDQLRAHVAALVRALDACRRTIGGRDADHPVVEQADYVLRDPDLAALVERERNRDAVVEAARKVKEGLYSDSFRCFSPAVGLVLARKALRKALSALDAPDGGTR